MSLVITSNVTGEDGNNALANGINLPFQYHNYLTQPLKLPPDSEVAVQSVKVVKDGNVALHRANNQFYLYTGDPITTGQSILDKTSVPIVGWINSDQIQTLNVENLATKIQLAMSVSVGDPMFLKATAFNGNVTNSSGVIVTTKRTSSGATQGSFEGYDIEFNLGVSASNVNVISGSSSFDFNTIGNFTDEDGNDLRGSYNSGSGILSGSTSTADGPVLKIGNLPMSRAAGKFSVSFKEAGGDDGSGLLFGWGIGLSRYQSISQYSELEFSQVNPGYFEQDELFYDYVVKSVHSPTDDKFFLRVYHSLADASVPNEISLQEFKYWEVGPSSASLSGPIEIFEASASYTTAKISKLEYTVSNERVKLEVLSDDGTSASYVLANGTQANKTHNLKPVNLNTYSMYPVLDFSKENVDTNDPKFTISTYNAIEIKQDNIDATYINQMGAGFGDSTPGPDVSSADNLRDTYDWYARQEGYGLTNTGSQSQQIDCRYMYDFDDTTGGPSDDGSYSQRGLTTNSVTQSVKLILKEDNRYVPSDGANAQSLLGFDNNPVPDPITDTSLLKKYSSNSSPTMISKASLFVRLDNVGTQSYNGQTTQPSKILYHMPRFDNSGLETGALFYEPNERTYVSLNNAQELIINDFDVTLVNTDETLADNLTGKTIIVLHFRKAKV